MASDLLGISVSGLRVSQSALSTTGHNISNAGVQGYSRQNVEAATNPATFQGGGYVGNGANVDNISRVANEFVTKQLRVDTSLYNDMSTYSDLVSQLDNLLSDQNTGLAGALDSFFSSVQNGSDDPTSIPARQLILSEGDNLVTRFNTVYSRFEQIEKGINESLSSAVSQVNALVGNLANINGRIGDSVNNGSGALPNDLLDQRDEALRQLSALISIQTFEQSNGEVNVLIGNGQNVVVGRETRDVLLQQNADDPTKQDIVFSANGVQQDLTQLISGGEIGGLLRFRDSSLDDSYNEFGRIAIALSDNFNRVQNQGITLDNEFGQDFFRDVNSPSASSLRVISSSENDPNTNRSLLLNINDSSQLLTTDYKAKIEGGGLYRIFRESDGQEIASGLLPGRTPFSIEFDGLELVFESGEFKAGDEFTLKPTRFGARDIQAALNDPRSVAFGAPLVTDASLGNQGTAQISAGDVLSLTDASGLPLPILANAGELSPPIIVRFTTPTTYDVLNNTDPGNPIQLDPPLRNQLFISGAQNSIFPTDIGQTKIAAQGALLGIPSGKNAIIGAGETLDNGYPAEAISFTLPPLNQGEEPRQQTIYTGVNASAKEIANTLSNVPGVSANAFNYIEVSNLQVSDTVPLQLALNGTDLLDYDTDPATLLPILSPGVPNPLSNPVDFNNYVADQINTNQNFQSIGVYAQSSIDSVTGNPALKIFSTQGDDLQIDLIASVGESISVSDGENDDVVLNGQGSGITAAMVAGGKFDVTLDSGITLRTFPPQSTLFGDSTASDFAKNSFVGIQASIFGSPEVGDDFTINFNVDGASDNRNALSLISIQTDSILSNGRSSLAEGYGSLVEKIGIDTSASTINAQASEQVLQQTEQTRNAISAVNLDEEAANLIRFEQMYSANAQVITVARNLFDTLIAAF